MLGEKWVVSSGGFGVEENYINAKAAENRAIRELRKWRFNIVTSYDFASDSKLIGSRRRRRRALPEQDQPRLLSEVHCRVRRLGLRPRQADRRAGRVELRCVGLLPSQAEQQGEHERPA